MKQKDLLYTGKAKSVYHTDTKGKLIVEFRDDITAFDGGKKDVLKNQLLKKGQQQPAIITCDGFLVNGNRRKMALEELLSHRRVI